VEQATVDASCASDLVAQVDLCGLDLLERGPVSEKHLRDLCPDDFSSFFLSLLLLVRVHV
jgi:hypothetical protein